MDEDKFKEFIAMMAAMNVKREQDKANFKPIAQSVKNWYDCFIEVGFSSDAALELTVSFLNLIGSNVIGGM